MDSIFLNTLKGIKTERPPVWFMRQAGRVLPSYMKLREKYSFQELMDDPELAAKVTLLPINDLGVDAAILFSDILVIPTALGLELEFTDNGPIFSNPLYKNPSSVKNVTPDKSKLEYIYKAIDAILQMRKPNTPLIGFCGAPLTVFCYIVQGKSTNHSFPEAIKFIYQYKEETKHLVSEITKLSVHYAEEQIKHGIDCFQLFETHAGLIPADIYEEVFMPGVREILHAVKAKNTPAIFFPKGIGAGLKNMAGNYTDFISIDWQTPLELAREILPDEIGVQGNIDPRLLYADKQTITNAFNPYIDFGSKNHNWIINLGHGLLPDIPYENVKHLVECIKTANWKRE